MYHIGRANPALNKTDRALVSWGLFLEGEKKQ